LANGPVTEKADEVPLQESRVSTALSNGSGGQAQQRHLTSTVEDSKEFDPLQQQQQQQQQKQLQQIPDDQQSISSQASSTSGIKTEPQLPAMDNSFQSQPMQFQGYGGGYNPSVIGQSSQAGYPVASSPQPVLSQAQSAPQQNAGVQSSVRQPQPQGLMPQQMPSVSMAQPMPGMMSGGQQPQMMPSSYAGYQGQGQSQPQQGQPQQMSQYPQPQQPQRAPISSPGYQRGFVPQQQQQQQQQPSPMGINRMPGPQMPAGMSASNPYGMATRQPFNRYPQGPAYQ
jgi:hypothetical protein